METGHNTFVQKKSGNGECVLRRKRALHVKYDGGDGESISGFLMKEAGPELKVKLAEDHHYVDVASLPSGFVESAGPA